jgi:hypothetical protein
VVDARLFAGSEKAQRIPSASYTAVAWADRRPLAVSAGKSFGGEFGHLNHRVRCGVPCFSLIAEPGGGWLPFVVGLWVGGITPPGRIQLR